MPLPALVEQWAYMLRAWADMWSSMLTGGGYQSAPQPGSAPAQAVCVRIVSHRPAEVTACLSPCAENLPLEIHVPNLDGIMIGREKCNVTIMLVVSNEQKPGVYPGRITACGREVGQVTVTIHDRKATE
jgi:hypothetical protein